MTLLDSLLDAIVRLEGDALVMHVGEKPYMVTTSSAMSAYRGPLAWGQVELSSRVLTADAVLGMLGQILPTDQRRALDEFGAVEHEIASPVGVHDRFSVVAARGGDDIWLELRRHPLPVGAPSETVAGSSDASAEANVGAAPVEPVAAAVGLQEAPELSWPMSVGGGEPPAQYQDDEAVVQLEPDDGLVVQEDIELIEVVDTLYEPAGESGGSAPSAPDTPAFAAVPDDASDAAIEEIPAIEERVPVFDEVGDHPPEHLEHIVIPVTTTPPAASATEEATAVDDDMAAALQIVEPEVQHAPSDEDVEDMLAASASALLAAGAGGDAGTPTMLEFEPESEALRDEATESEANLAEGFFEVVDEEETSVEALDSLLPTAASAAAPAREPAAANRVPDDMLFPVADVPPVMPEMPVDHFSPMPIAATTHDAHASAPAGAAAERVSHHDPAAPAPTAGGPSVVVPIGRSAAGGDRPEAGARVDDQVLVHVLQTAVERGASTVYMVAQSKPMLRVDGEISPLEPGPVLDAPDIERLINTLGPAKGSEPAAVEGLEWVSQVPKVGRVRCLSFRDHRGPGIIFRLISTRTISADYLNISPEIRDLCAQTDGLVLVSGAHTSGKTTLVNSLVDLINRTRSDHVVTVENEIAFAHESQRSFVSQREIAEPAAAAAAIRAALREDPDVLMVEEITSAEVAGAVLEAADSGRLVLASITAPAAAAAVEALVELLPEGRRSAARATLSAALRGVVGQVLVRRTTGGRTAARELLLNTSQVAPLIVQGHTNQITAALEAGQRQGMVPLSDSLASLVRAGSVHPAEAVRRAPDRKALLAAFERDGLDTTFAERAGVI